MGIRTIQNDRKREKQCLTIGAGSEILPQDDMLLYLDSSYNCMGRDVNSSPSEYVLARRKGYMTLGANYKDKSAKKRC